MPVFGNSQLKLLEKLCNATSVSGDEGEVRRIVIEELKSSAVNFTVDALGNVLVPRPGSGKQRLRVMLSAHMDEVGFMLVADDGDGLFRFETVGRIDIRQLPGKAVLVGKEHLPGVIGAKPIHMTTAEERRQKIPLDVLRIDMGPGTSKAKLGDRATFATRFQRNGSVIIAKALDNRLGVAILLELVRKAPANIDLLAAFTVQEETGLRGAKVAAYSFNPDLAFIMDSTPANDLPDWEDEENISYNSKLGLGPAIYIADSGTISDRRLIHLMQTTALARKLPYQVRQPGGGGTDAGVIHISRAGFPCLSVSIPHRYSHTSASIALVEDWKNTFTLLEATLSNITPELVLSGQPH